MPRFGSFSHKQGKPHWNGCSRCGCTFWNVNWLAVLRGKPVFVCPETLPLEPSALSYSPDLRCSNVGVTEQRPIIRAKLTRSVAGASGRRTFLSVHVYEKEAVFLLNQ